MKHLDKALLLRLFAIFAFALVALCGVITLRAQDKKPEDQRSKPAAPMYRLTYTVTELDGTKRLGVQHFSLTLNPPEYSEIKLGSKIPIATGNYSGGATVGMNTQFTYVDIGLEIGARLTEYANGIEVATNVDQTSVAEAPNVDIHQPVIRQTRLRTTALLTPGKPVVIGSLDTPGSTRHLDIEVVMEPVH